MTESPNIESALNRFSNAVLELEASVDRRLKNEQNSADLHKELQQMGDDRAKIAESLDDAVDRADRLEAANREVSRRLVDAMETIRSIVEDKGD